jgi:transposase
MQKENKRNCEMKKKPIADWSEYEKRAPWYTVTSRELSKILGVSLQTINNWKMRDILPSPEPYENYKGNVNRYKISKIKMWLEGRTEKEINQDFIEHHMEISPEDITQPQAEYMARLCYDVYEIEKPPK